MGVSIQEERFSDIVAELPALFVAHDTEIHKEPEALPLDVDWLGYMMSEAQGVLHVLTVRDGKDLVGYCFLFISKSLQTSVTTSATDIVYLKPEYREGWTGFKIYKAAKELSRRLGAKKLYLGEHGADTYERLFSRLGAKKVETLYAVLL